MIDIHSHILFDADDGPMSKEESIQMLEYAVNEGITEIVSTSHVLHPQYNANAKIVKDRLTILQEKIESEKIPLKIHLGHEVRLRIDLVDLIKNNEVYTLANSRYVLLELPFQEVPNYTVNIIQDLLEEGFIPVIAHPERNKGIADKPARLTKLITHGAIAQITAGSIAGHFGKNIQKLSLQLVDANLVHVYGSDAHNLKNRPFLFDDGLTYLEKNKRLENVDIFLENNARIVENKEIILLEPENLKLNKWWNLFN